MNNETNSREIKSILNAIRTKHVEHREYVDARDALYTHATYSAPGTPILMLGPSRVGKSKVAKAVRNMLERENDVGGTKSMFTEAVNPDRSHFSMKHLTLRLLTELKHPLYGFQQGDAKSGVHDQLPKRSTTEPILRMALENAMQSREIRWMFVDEAHHIVLTHKKQKARNNLDSIKSLGNTSGVVQAWVGGYELLTNGFTSTHLNGRMRIIHFKRYGSSPEDKDEFLSTLASLNCELPFPPGKCLLDIAGPLQAYTFGCVGAVLTWTEAALTQMVVKKDRYLKPEHFTATRFALQLDGLADEIRQGEELLQNVDLDGTLELPPEQSLELPGEISAMRKKPRTKGVQRNPKRDRVGSH